MGSWRGASRCNRKGISSFASGVVSISSHDVTVFQRSSVIFFCREFYILHYTLMKNSCSLPVPKRTCAGHIIACSTNLLQPVGCVFFWVIACCLDAVSQK